MARDEDFWVVWATMGLRMVLAATAAGLFYSQVPLTSVQVRVIESVLFGGLITILAFSQYLGVSELLRHDNVPSAVAFTKNGVIQVFALMGLYGTFIPNDLKTAAGVIVSMALIVAIAGSTPAIRAALSADPAATLRGDA